MLEDQCCVGDITRISDEFQNSAGSEWVLEETGDNEVGMDLEELSRGFACLEREKAWVVERDAKRKSREEVFGGFCGN